jgi:hypothetical protein
MVFRAYFTNPSEDIQRHIEVAADCTHDALVRLPQNVVNNLDSLFILHDNGKLERV